MKTTDFVRQALESGRSWIDAMLNGLEGNELTFPTSQGGNHPLWVVGHLAWAEAAMVGGFILGEENPLARWESLFGMGSQPVADASRYPAMSELRAEWARLRARTLEVLASMTEADLDRPSKAPAEWAEMFGTIGKVFGVVVNHQMFHAGQVADARRAAGLKPVFA